MYVTGRSIRLCNFNDLVPIKITANLSCYSQFVQSENLKRISFLIRWLYVFPTYYYLLLSHNVQLIYGIDKSSLINCKSIGV